MRHSLPNIEPGVYAGRNRALDIGVRVVEQHLVVADVDADGWPLVEMTSGAGRRKTWTQIGVWGTQ